MSPILVLGNISLSGSPPSSVRLQNSLLIVPDFHLQATIHNSLHHLFHAHYATLLAALSPLLRYCHWELALSRFHRSHFERYRSSSTATVPPADHGSHGQHFAGLFSRSVASSNTLSALTCVIYSRRAIFRHQTCATSPSSVQHPPYTYVHLKHSHLRLLIDHSCRFVPFIRMRPSLHRLMPATAPLGPTSWWQGRLWLPTSGCRRSHVFPQEASECGACQWECS